MLPQLIGITGKAGSGKDTLADYLVDTYGAQKYNFARPLKEALNAMFGWQMHQWDDREWKEREISWLGKSPRQMAQTMGTEWGRELVHPELWVRIAEKRYMDHLDSYYAGHAPPFVIPDLRFDNEARMIKDLGGVIVELIRPDAAPVSAHKSESGINNSLVNIIVLNSGTVSEYIHNTIAALKVVKAK